MTKHCCESDCVGCETYAKIKEARKKQIKLKGKPKKEDIVWR